MSTEIRKTTVLRDGSGFPVLFTAADREKRTKNLLGDTPRSEIVTPDATSGPAEWGRYSDAVREASRSFDAPEDGDINQFLNARAKSPEKVDVPAFTEAVHRQRHADLVDILDHHLRVSGSLPRGSRHVRIQAPKGYLRKALRHSSPEDLAHIRHRLVSIGHDQLNVDKYIGNRVKPDVWAQATNYEVRMSDTEFEGLLFDDSDSGWRDDDTDPSGGEIAQAITDAIGSIKIEPVIHIHMTPEDESE